ncbi:MAG: excinuclease ABC subunit UvrC [Oscillospiraceae bacterium]|jgi:excinuclease ABC subunit C
MIEMLREKANRLPLLPGVYCMLDEHGEVIYVGKAKKLKNRVTSYFRGEHEPKTAAMVSKVADFHVVVVNSEFEALVLENSLIKRHKPHYNILLRDDKGYPFVRLDLREAYPSFEIVNRVSRDGARYFGPYGGRGQTTSILDSLCKALKLPTCSKKFPRDIGKARPCLNHQMGLCAGWCRKNSDPTEYRRRIEEARLILEGKADHLRAEMETEMMQAAEQLRFERAAELRDRLRAISGLSNRQKVIGAVFADTDAVGFFRSAKCCFTVLHYVDGVLAGKDFELMEEPIEEDSAALSALVRQYYTMRGVWPKVILLPWEIEDAEALEMLLTESAGRKVSIEVPKRGDRLRLSETAQVNAREESLRVTTAAQRGQKTLEWLQTALELPTLPQRIEAFDISNMGNTGVVAAMAVFKNGKPLKRDYRKFRIREVNGQDDYHSMQEAVSRRFQRYRDSDSGFSNKPDLLLIDGGATHASAALAVLQELGLSIPVFGMVKDDRHRTRALMSPDGHEIGITANQAVFALIGNIQEETHRTAIEYQRSLRNEGFASELDQIKGVGKKRRSDLLCAFRTVKAIREAALAELEAVVPANVAKEVYDYYHSGTEKK